MSVAPPPPTTLIAQLTDPHVTVGRGDRDSARALAAAVRAVLALSPQPHAVVVTGDLVEHATAREYERVRELLAPIPLPVHVLPGNHDDRDALRVYFDPSGTRGKVGDPYRYVARAGHVRLVLLDTILPGQAAGALDPSRLTWLGAALAFEPDVPTVVAMHHPPVLTGIAGLDAIGLPAADRAALGDLLALNPHVRRIVAGHVHRPVFGVLGGCGVVVAPSTHLQTRLELEGPSLDAVPEPPGFALHAVTGDDVVSHVQLVDRAA